MDEIAEVVSDEVLWSPSRDMEHGRRDPFDDAVLGAAEDDVRGIFGQQAVFLLPAGQGGADANGGADVADRGAAEFSALLLQGFGDFEAGPEVRAVGLFHAQLAGLRFFRGEQLLACEVEGVLIRGLNDAGEGQAGEFVAGQAEERGRGEVRLEDGVGLVERDVTHGSEIEEIEVAGALRIERGLQTTQLLVLHLQLDLVHEEFVHRLFFVAGCELRPRHAGHRLFGLAAEFRGVDVRLRVHAASGWACSVVAMP